MPSIKSVNLIPMRLLPLALTLATLQMAAAQGLIRQHIDTLQLIQDMFTNQARKYQTLLDGSFSEDDVNHPETRDRAQTLSLWHKVHQVGSLLLGQTQPKRARSFRRLSGELPAERLHELNLHYEQNRKLAELEKSGSYELDQQTSKQMHERHMKNIQSNHHHQFAPEVVKTFDFQPVLPKYQQAALLMEDLSSKKTQRVLQALEE